MKNLPKFRESGQALLIQNGQALLTQTGQALLMVVLSLAVVLTLVLSILARSITDIKISTGGEEALRAFSAAEAGIETSLNSLIVGQSSGNLEGASFKASVTKVGEAASFFANPNPLFSGETSLFWFVGHDGSGNLSCGLGANCFTGSKVKICWGKEGTSSSSSDTPAIEASVVYATTPGDYSTPQIARATIDPNSSRTASNSFSAPDAGGCTLGTENFAFQKTLDLSSLGIPASSYNNPNGLQFLIVRMLYNESVSHTAGISVDFSGNGVLPAQGSTIDSLGSSGESNRKINVFQGYGEPPLPLGAVVFSPTGITK